MHACLPFSWFGHPPWEQPSWRQKKNAVDAQATAHLGRAPPQRWKQTMRQPCLLMSSDQKKSGNEFRCISPHVFLSFIFTRLFVVPVARSLWLSLRRRCHLHWAERCLRSSNGTQYDGPSVHKANQKGLWKALWFTSWSTKTWIRPSRSRRWQAFRPVLWMQPISAWFHHLAAKLMSGVDVARFT